MLKPGSLVCLIAAATLFAVNKADALTVNSGSSGTYRSDGTAASGGILAGTSSLTFHNWFSFDLSSAAGQTVISGQLVIPVNSPPTKYLTDAGSTSETYDIFDYLGSIPALTGGTAGLAGYTDLGNGTAYGSVAVGIPSSGPGDMSTVTVTLSAGALADLNALLGGASFAFALGGVCSTCSTTEYLWGNAYPDTLAYLDLELGSVSGETPLPAALPLFAGGLGVMAFLARRRKQRAQAEA